jgi:hypothetical protein
VGKISASGINQPMVYATLLHAQQDALTQYKDNKAMFY